MNQKAAYAEKLRRQRKLQMDVQRRFTIQQCRDVMMITMNEHFGWGAKRLTELGEMFDKEMAEFILMALEDDQDDRKLNYTKGKIDERLRKIFNDPTIRFENRYPKEVK